MDNQAIGKTKHNQLKALLDLRSGVRIAQIGKAIWQNIKQYICGSVGIEEKQAIKNVLTVIVKLVSGQI